MYDSFRLRDVYEDQPERIARLVGKPVTVKLFDGDGTLYAVGVGKLTLAVVSRGAETDELIEAVQVEDATEAIHTARDTTRYITITGEVQ